MHTSELLISSSADGCRRRRRRRRNTYEHKPTICNILTSIKPNLILLPQLGLLPALCMVSDSSSISYRLWLTAHRHASLQQSCFTR